MQTRAKNANTHPGNIVKGPPRRSPAEVAAARQVEKAQKKHDEDERLALIARLAEIEARSKNPDPLSSLPNTASSVQTVCVNSITIFQDTHTE